MISEHGVTAVRCQTDDALAVSNVLLELVCSLPEGTRVVAGVEMVTAFAPGGARIGARTAQTIGEMQGVPKGVLAAMGIPVTVVRPQDWHKHVFRGKTKPKERKRVKAAIFRAAQQRWPKVGLRYVTAESGPADALWIAYHLSKTEV